MQSTLTGTYARVPTGTQLIEGTRLVQFRQT